MAAGRFLRWMLLLNALNFSVGHGPRLNVRGDYEVVRPVRLHTVNKRHAQNDRPQTVKYALTVSGRPLELHLDRNDDFLTKDYKETHYLEDGTRVTTTPDHIDHCYYHGKIAGDSLSEASISTCDGLRGYIQTSEQRFLIEPLTSEPEGDHAVRSLEETKPSTCGVTNDTWAADEEPPSRSRSRGLSILSEPKYVELYLVVDHTAFTRDSKMTTLRPRIYEMVNFVNMVYKPLLTFVALVGLEVWTDANKIVVTSNTGQNLNNFMDWRNKNLANTKHDCAHLISGVDFDGSTVGLAYVGAMCTAYSVGVVEDFSSVSAAVGATLAHELGHNLGMSHDTSTCTCSGTGCIMGPSVMSWSLPETFSSCSRSKYEEFLLGRSVNCLLDKPDYRTLVAPPVCGNGFVEDGEQCDCGSITECKDPCCNAATCRFSVGSQCAEGECCKDCKIRPRSHECRPKEDECDLAEYCDGVSARCPEDVFSANGVPCDNARGYCYNGECPQRPSQCVKMFGPGAIEGRPDCFEFNKHGKYYGYCKRPSKDQYIACPKADIYCGKLFCHNGNEYSIYGGVLKVNDCKATHFEDFTKDYGQVETGTKCAEGKVCIQNQCMDLETGYRTAECSAKCPIHSVCNHWGQCQCEPGWMPPYCDKEDKESSSVTVTYLSPGAIAGITIAVIVAVCCIVAGLLFFLKKR